MTILNLQEIVRKNPVYIIDGIKDLIPEIKLLSVNQTDKQYVGDNYRINDIILSVNQIDVYLDIVNESIVINNYYTDGKKSIVRHTYHNYVKIIEDGKFRFEKIYISTSELIRRSLQNTRFPKMEMAKNVEVQYCYDLTNLNFNDIIIPDFNPDTVFPIYKRFIKEKYKVLLPRIKELKEDISDNQAMSYVFITEGISEEQQYSPFSLEDIIKEIEDDIVIDKLTIRQCANKLLMTNDWLRKIHYTVLSNIDLANECKRYLLRTYGSNL